MYTDTVNTYSPQNHKITKQSGFRTDLRLLCNNKII